MNTRKFRILMVHNYYQIPGGEDTVVANEMQMLKKYGHHVVFYSRNNSELNEMSKFQKLFLPVNTIFNFRTYRDIKRIIKQEKIDIVHVHNTLNLISPSVYYAAIQCGVPVVQTVHNFRLLCPGAIFYRNGHICEDCLEKGLWCAIRYNCYRNSKMQTLACVISTKFHRIIGIYGKINYICLTDFNKEKLLKLKQVKENKIFIKPNFVENTQKFIPVEKRENQFVFSGRLDKLKGIDILLKSWKKMGKRAPKLIVCGTGPMEEWCKEFVEKNKINVEIKGFISNEDVKKILANSKALILPTQLYEGFPMSIVEAYSVGTPVIGSNIGNVKSVIEERITGVIFTPTSKEMLIEAIIYILGFHNIQESTKNVYLEKYTIQKNYIKLLNIYESVMK